jgi:hypothetical protein
MAEAFNSQAEIQIIPLLATGAFPGSPAGYRFGMASASSDPGTGGLEEQPEINNGSEPTEPALSPGDPKATFSTVPRKSMIGWLLKYHIGNPAPTGTTPDYVNTFKFGDLDPACLELYYSDIGIAHQFGGGVGLGGYITKMDWSFKQGGFIVTPCEFWGPFVKAAAQKDATPTDYADVISANSQVTLKKDTVAWAKCLELNFTTDRQPAYVPGAISTTTKVLTLGVPKVSGNMKLMFEDDDMRLGASAGTEYALEITITWTVGHHKLVIGLNELKLSNFKYNVSGQNGRVDATCDFVGYYSDHAAATAASFALTNGVAHTSGDTVSGYVTPAA